MIPAQLVLRAVDCGDCRTSRLQDQVIADVHQIASGGELLLSITCDVALNVWPGQTVATVWDLTAASLPPQRRQVNIELPWAELPATGLPRKQGGGEPRESTWP